MCKIISFHASSIYYNSICNKTKSLIDTIASYNGYGWINGLCKLTYLLTLVPQKMLLHLKINHQRLPSIVCIQYNVLSLNNFPGSLNPKINLHRQLLSLQLLLTDHPHSSSHQFCPLSWAMILTAPSRAGHYQTFHMVITKNYHHNVSCTSVRLNFIQECRDEYRIF